MKMTPPKIVTLFVVAGLLASVSTALIFKRYLLSPAGFAAQGGQAAMRQQGMRAGGLPQYAAPDLQALADLESKVLDRQLSKETTNEITINLKPYVNCKLTDPLADQAGKKDHTLQALPAGVHTYGGVPFDVQGLIQLNGQSVRLGIKLWPLEVKDIAIGHPCNKLHLLQGAFNIVTPKGHRTYAKLILHYADGSQQELELVNGRQALRCVDRAIPQELNMLPAPQTELGWVGTNPYLKKNNPGASLHLYRITFANPKPDMPVATVDYLSTMANPGPFMVGLTIE